MRQLPREHPAKAPADQKDWTAVMDFVQPLTELVERIVPGAPIYAEAPRVHTPPRPGERPAQVHRGAIAGKESRENERRRPVLRAARADGTKPR
jgi:hypothetical protein